MSVIFRKILHFSISPHFAHADVLHEENYSLSVSKYDSFNHFDAVNFSVLRSKEVICFF